MSDNDCMYVITRTGKREPLDPTMILNRIRRLINKEPKIPHINAHDIMLKACSILKTDITTAEIDECVANLCASMSISNYYCMQLASRLAIDNHQKQTFNSFTDKMKKAYLNKTITLLSEPFIKYVEEHTNELERMIDYGRDFNFDFFGLRTFQSQFSIKLDGKPIERFQDMFMRTAIALNMHTCQDEQIELARIKETYDLLSMKRYTHASPTYYNAGAPFQQFASCFLLGTEDSLEGIMQTATNASQISKRAGGIGIHVHNWRAAGSLIKGTNGRSSGICDDLRIIEACMQAFNQGGRRPGSAKIYLMPHHPDLMRFIEMRRTGGIEREHARDLFYAIWAPDIFFERIINDEKWSFFDPNTCGDLADLHGEAYRKRYLELEEAKKYTHQLPARLIWQAIEQSNRETGMPDILASDTINRCSMQSNIGTIRSSNLCDEIVQFSNSEEYAVCVLASICLPSFVLDNYTEEELAMPAEQRRPLDHTFPTNPRFDFDQMRKTVHVVCRNLNNIIDKSYMPTRETKRGIQRQRAIGIGVQGLDDVYAMFRYPFESPAAASLNKLIFETLYYAALTASTQLSREFYLNAVKQCKEQPITIEEHYQNSYETGQKTYTDPSLIPKTIGSYPAMLFNEGAPIYHGKFHWELAGKTTGDLSGMYDWETLRSHIMQYGVRNSMCVALMPTASTSQLMGNNECFEPCTFNIYRRNTSAGEFVVFKKYLIHDLYRLGLWNEDLRKKILVAEGGIQHIKEIPANLRALYKTAYEIDQAAIIKQAIDRQPFVDQAQSMNLYIANFTSEVFLDLHMLGWSEGLKTLRYYVHSKPGKAALKFAIDPEAQKAIQEELQTQGFAPSAKDICDVCGA